MKQLDANTGTGPRNGQVGRGQDGPNGRTWWGGEDRGVLARIGPDPAPTHDGYSGQYPAEIFHHPPVHVHLHLGELAGPITAAILRNRTGLLESPGSGGTVDPTMTTGVATSGAERPSRSGMEALPFPPLPRAAIADAIDAAAADMTRRGAVAGSIKRARSIWTECAAHAGWETPADVGYATASAWLAHKRQSGWSGPTHDQGVSFLRVLGRYLHRAGLTSENPLQYLESSGESGGDGSRALSTEEMRAMIRTALQRQRSDARARGNRALFWCFLALTGLRTAEAEACRWRDLDLDGEPPALYTDPGWAKNGRKMRVVLNDEIAGLLREHRRSVPCQGDDPVFPVTPNRASWRQVRELAGVAAEDGRGREATPHSARKWLATTLDQTGATPGVVSRIIRHAGSLAEARYIDPDVAAEVAAVGRLPRLWPGGEKKSGGAQGPEDAGVSGGDEGAEKENALAIGAKGRYVGVATSTGTSAVIPSPANSVPIPGAGSLKVSQPITGAQAPGIGSELSAISESARAAGSFESSARFRSGNGHLGAANDPRSQSDGLSTGAVAALLRLPDGDRDVLARALEGARRAAP